MDILPPTPTSLTGETATPSAGNVFCGNLAKMSNVWRAPHNASKLYNKWRSLFGKDRGDEVAKKMPPRALTGRFGCTHTVESFYMRCGAAETSRVHYELLTGKKSTRTSKKGDILDVDEEAESYDDKMGRWARGAGLAAASARHWTIMNMAHAARDPAMNMMNWHLAIVGVLVWGRRCASCASTMHISRVSVHVASH